MHRFWERPRWAFSFSSFPPLFTNFRVCRSFGRTRHLRSQSVSLLRVCLTARRAPLRTFSIPCHILLLSDADSHARVFVVLTCIRHACRDGVSCCRRSCSPTYPTTPRREGEEKRTQDYSTNYRKSYITQNKESYGNFAKRY